MYKREELCKLLFSTLLQMETEIEPEGEKDIDLFFEEDDGDEIETPIDFQELLMRSIEYLDIAALYKKLVLQYGVDVCDAAKVLDLDMIEKAYNYIGYKGCNQRTNNYSFIKGQRIYNRYFDSSIDMVLYILLMEIQSEKVIDYFSKDEIVKYSSQLKTNCRSSQYYHFEIQKLSPKVKSKFVCKLLLGTCGTRGCLASLD